MHKLKAYLHEAKAGAKTQKDQRTIKKDQSVSGKHQRKFSFPLSLTMNGP